MWFIFSIEYVKLKMYFVMNITKVNMIMKIEEIIKRFNISNSTIKNWIKIGLLPKKSEYEEEEIESVINSKSHSRRIKKKSTTLSIPESYIKKDKTIRLIRQIAEFQNAFHLDSKQILGFLIQKVLGGRITDTIEKEMTSLFGSIEDDLSSQSIFQHIQIEYDNNEDFLGAVYSSFLTVGDKSTAGVYYTPFVLVDEMVNQIDLEYFTDNRKIIDPACGSGNFLINIINKLKEKNISEELIVKSVYGYDIDPIAVFIAKINIYLILNETKFESINVFVKDFLLEDTHEKFQYVVGNPPWGLKFTDSYKKKLQSKLYYNASKQDSFALFIEKSIDILDYDGYLDFVLPVSFLNVKKHNSIRNVCLKYEIKRIKSIGREFSEVVTENLIFKLKKTLINKGENTLIYDDKKVEQSYFLNNPLNAYLVAENNIVQDIIDKVNKHSLRNLNHNVKFGMGIVTGDNSKYIQRQLNEENEMIATGNNLEKFFVNKKSIDKFIVFNPKLYQQVAPTEIYRHNSRILYNFIGNKIKFSYDTSGLLTLNSANIICLNEGWDPFYVLAILNSRITQIYFKNVFNTYKLLRSHVESFRIFEFDEASKNIISRYSKEIFETKDLRYYEDIEQIIYDNLNLSQDEIQYLKVEIKI